MRIRKGSYEIIRDSLFRSCLTHAAHAVYHSAMNLTKLKDKALRAALPLLAGSAVGRLAIDKGIDLLSHQIGIPIAGDYDKAAETWLITIGETGAPMQARFHLTNDALSSLLEELVPDLVHERPVSRDRILALLKRYLTAGYQDEKC